MRFQKERSGEIIVEFENSKPAHLDAESIQHLFKQLSQHGGGILVHRGAPIEVDMNKTSPNNYLWIVGGVVLLIVVYFIYQQYRNRA